MAKNLPLVLLILDGWGLTEPSSGNAISLAETPNLNNFSQNYPSTQLQASGEAVGLPVNEDGNSEVGHLNLGAGRIVAQSLARINLSIVTGEFFNNSVFEKAIVHVKQNNSALHLMGLIGSGSVHAHNDHLYALIQLAKKRGVEKLYLHLIVDGRDSPPTDAKVQVHKLQVELQKVGVGRIVTLMGRYYAMDRDLRWRRTALAYEALTEPIENRHTDPIACLEKCYQRSMTDEFFEPMIIGEDADQTRIKSGDAVIFFNYRIDRPRQLTKAFVLKDFEHTAMIIKGFDSYDFHYKKYTPIAEENMPFKRRVILDNLVFVTMTEYEPGLPAEVAFPSEILKDTLGEVVAKAGLKQLRLAETEKERFVTFYFNGRTETHFTNEDRLILPSPKVATYDLMPEMATPEIGQALVSKLDEGKYQLYVVNFASPDMVAHSGDIEATIKAVETVDVQVGQIAAKIREMGGTLLITADHGNAEEMLVGNGSIDTEHSINPVPFILVNESFKGGKLAIGMLGDVAPTVLHLLELEQPEAMTGRSLVVENQIGKVEE